MIKTRYTSIGEEYFDVTEKIVRLSDELSEEIILENIRETLEEKPSPFRNKINYLSLYIDRFNRITGTEDFYDKEFMEYSSTRVCSMILKSVRDNYGVSLGKDLDFYSLDDYLKDTDTLYEFLYLRQFENISNYIYSQLLENKEQLVESYTTLLNSETHSRDVFVQLAKRKFKKEEDVAIIHFIGDIISDIISMTESGYKLFEIMASFDPHEEYNDRFLHLLGNYGEAITFEGDQFTYTSYMRVMDDAAFYNDVRNRILMKYLETAEIEEDGSRIEDTLYVSEEDL